MEMRIRLRLREILEELGMSQGELSRRTGIRKAAISEMACDLRTTWNKQHIAKICEALNIKDASKLFIIEEISVKPAKES